MTDEKRPGEVEITVVEGDREGTSPGEAGAGRGDQEAEPAADLAIQEELTRLQQEVDRLRELYLRKLADFDNYRKRQEKEMADFRRLANAEILRDLCPVLDNLERALAVPEGNGSGLRTGVELVLRQLKDILGRYGLVEVNPQGEPFDPALHEAIQRQECGEAGENTVIEVLQKGYLLGERLLRPALVVVATRQVKPKDGPSSSETRDET